MVKKKISNLLDSPMLTTKEAAALLSLHPVAVSNMRVKKVGPPYIKMGKGRVRYPQRLLEEWATKNIVIPEEAA